MGARLRQRLGASNAAQHILHHHGNKPQVIVCCIRAHDEILLFFNACIGTALKHIFRILL